MIHSTLYDEYLNCVCLASTQGKKWKSRWYSITPRTMNDVLKDTTPTNDRRKSTWRFRYECGRGDMELPRHEATGMSKVHLLVEWYLAHSHILSSMYLVLIMVLV